MNSEATPVLPKLAYSIAELVQATSLSRTTIYNEIKAGNLQVAHIGDRPLIEADEARRWLASKRKSAV
jgi:hypothetical protein